MGITGATPVSRASAIRMSSLLPSRRMCSITALFDFSNRAADDAAPHSNTSCLMSSVFETCLVFLTLLCRPPRPPPRPPRPSFRPPRPPPPRAASPARPLIVHDDISHLIVKMLGYSPSLRRHGGSKSPE